MSTGPTPASSRPTPSRPPIWSRPNRRQADPPIPESRTQEIAKPDRSLYTIVHLDLAMSAGNGCQAQRRMRDDLYDLVGGVLQYGGMALESLPYTDTGDGLRLVVPLDRIEPTQVVDMFVLGLTAGLREHRRRMNETARIRMRVAFDLGIVEPHLRSWTGDPLVRAARLVDAEPLREALRSNRILDLVAVVSDVLYESVVRHGYGYIAPACFQAIHVRVKEFEAVAWLLKPQATGLCGQCYGLAA